MQEQAQLEPPQLVSGHCLLAVAVRQTALIDRGWAFRKKVGGVSLVDVASSSGHRRAN
jgi:hypothetical protein